ncbi:hypothetical protein JCM8097_004063 [Rhodosporidiobolus ruineniae]
MATPTALLLLAIAHTLLLALAAVPVLHIKQLHRAGRQLVFLPTASTSSASLAGLLGLVALGTGSRGAAVVGGVAGALSVSLSLVLHVALLCLDSPTHSTLLGVAVGRAAVHIVVTLTTVAVLARSAVQDARLVGVDVENGLSTPRKGETYEAWRARVNEPANQQDSRVTWRDRFGSTQSHLALLQALAVLLDIFSVAFPLHPSYALFDARRRAPPTLLGTTISPTGYLVMSIFIAVRWTCVLVKTAGSASPLSGPSKSSLAGLYQRTPTPSPSTAPLAPGRADSPTSTRRPSTSRSRMLADGTYASRASSPWSTSAVEHGDYLGSGGEPSREVSASPSSTVKVNKSKRTRQLSLSSVLSSFGKSHTHTRRGQPATGGGVQVELQPAPFPYYHTETRPAPYPASSSGSAEREDSPADVEEDLVVSTEEQTTPTPARPAFISHHASRSLPPLLTQPRPVTPPASPGPSSSADSSPIARRRNSSGFSFAPLLNRTAPSTASSSPVHEFSPSPLPPSTPLPPSSPDFVPVLDFDRTRPHGSSASSATAYYSLPRSPLPPSAGQSSPKKPSRRPSIARLPSFGGASQTASSSAGGPADSPTRARSRSGSVGSLLRALKRESATASLQTGESGGGGWEVEPNEAEDDPFVRTVGREGREEAERVREWKRRSTEALAVGVPEVETVQERSEENEQEQEQDEGETGSVIDYGSDVDGSDAVERVLTPIPMDEAEQADFDGLTSSFFPRDDSPATARPRRPSESSSIFVEHLDDEPAPLQHSASAGSLGRAYRLDGSPAPGLVHAQSYGSLPRTPQRRKGAEKTSTSPYAAASERFQRGLDGEQENTARSPPPVLSSPAYTPTVTSPASSSRASSPLQALKPIPTRPSLLPTSRFSSSSPSPQPRRSSTSTSASSLLASASFSLRRLRAKATSLPTETRQSTASDLSFACRGPVGSSSDLGRPLSPPVALSRPTTRLDALEDEVEQVDSLAGPVRSSFPAPQEQPKNPATDQKGRSTWWKQLPGSRPSTHYRRSGLARSASSSASFPSFFRGSTSGSSSGHSHGQRHSSLQVPPSSLLRLSAYQLEEPASVSPIGSLVHLHSPRTSHETSSPSPTSALPPFLSRPTPLFRSHSTGTAYHSRTLGSQPSAAASHRSFYSARTGGSSTGHGAPTTSAGGSGGEVIAEEHLSELDDLVRTFSPGALLPDPQWPTYPPADADAASSAADLGGSFEFSEHGFSGGGSGSDEVHEHGMAYELDGSRREHRSEECRAALARSDDDDEADLSGDVELSPLSPAFSYASTTSATFERDGEEEFVSPITPASFTAFGGGLGERLVKPQEGGAEQRE